MINTQTYNPRLENPDILPEIHCSERNITELDDELYYEWMQTISGKATDTYANLDSTINQSSALCPYDFTNINEESSAVKTDFGLEIISTNANASSETLPTFSEILSPSKDLSSILQKTSDLVTTQINSTILSQALADNPTA